MEYTTERGVTIDIVPIPLLLDKVRLAHPEPPRPTYTEHLAGGGTQEVVISDAEAVAWQANDPETWAQHEEAWTEYQAAMDAHNDKLNDVIWKAILKRSIRVELPEDDGWIEDQRDLGIDVPDDRRERLAHYIWTECIGGPRDIIRITAMANGADLTEDALHAAEESFRGQLSGQTSSRLENQARGMDARE
jgi:hypothetical protein